MRTDLRTPDLTRLARWLIWPIVLAITAFTLCPIQFRPTTPAPADLERIFAFIVLGILLSIAYQKMRLLSFSLAVVGAALIEAAQKFSPGRHGHLHDFDVKVVGIVSGMLLGILLLKLCQPRHISG
jgi:VanZ family protein